LSTTDLLAIEPSAIPQSAEFIALNIHGAIHQAYEEAQCVLHTHMPYATALTCLDRGRSLFVHQNSLRFWDDVAYDEIYNGVADTPAEGQRIATAMDSKRVLFLANHGVIVTGKKRRRSLRQTLLSRASLRSPGVSNVDGTNPSRGRP
jgi:ribulose-5-phosphate 4-epimerase/fuculose-1-phosphate aldolase